MPLIAKVASRTEQRGRERLDAVGQLEGPHLRAGRAAVADLTPAPVPGIAVFYRPLTEPGPGGNPMFRSVCVMTAQLPPASGYEGGFPRPRTGSHSTLISGDCPSAGVHPGESNPARMLSGVLLLVVAAIIVGLTLAWWLA